MTLAILAALAAVAGCATSAPASSAPATAASAASNAESGTTSTLYDVACLTASRCFAVGDAGTLLATTDGGRAWQREASPAGAAGAAGAAPLYRIACAPPASCYVIARPGTILVTHDAGAHWAARTLPVNVPGIALAGCAVGDPSVGEIPCRLGLLDISCPSALTCYAVATLPGGWNTNPISQSSGAGPGSSLWLTQDGGATWTSQPIATGVFCDGDCSNILYRYPLEWVSCAPSGPCWAGGNQLIGSHEGFAGALLTTPAPGGSWRLDPVCPPDIACSDAVTDVGACPTAAGCYAIDNSNPFGNGNSGVSIYTATGQNGRNVTMPGNVVLTDIACPAAHTCYTVGAGGVILRTTNDTRFTPIKTSSRENLNGITCVTAADCYAVGAAGTIEVLR
jgi:Photosynthesis system II assembly factor YCF48